MIQYFFSNNYNLTFDSFAMSNNFDISHYYSIIDLVFATFIGISYRIIFVHWWIFLHHWFSRNYVLGLYAITLSGTVQLLQHSDIKSFAQSNNMSRIHVLCRLGLLHTLKWLYAQIEYNGLFKNWWGHHVNPLVISHVILGDSKILNIFSGISKII